LLAQREKDKKDAPIKKYNNVYDKKVIGSDIKYQGKKEKFSWYSQGQSFYEDFLDEEKKLKDMIKALPSDLDQSTVAQLQEVKDQRKVMREINKKGWSGSDQRGPYPSDHTRGDVLLQRRLNSAQYKSFQMSPQGKAVGELAGDVRSTINAIAGLFSKMVNKIENDKADSTQQVVSSKVQSRST